MKITGVHTETTESQGPVYNWRKGIPGGDGKRIDTKLTITTDEGITGEAHGARGVIISDLVERHLRRELVGQDPLMKEYLWHRMWEVDRIEEFPIYFLGLADIALWDITAKVAGQPLFKMIGGFRNRIPAYASTVTYDSVEEFLDIADQCLDFGFRAIKLHAWGDARRDARLGEALRAHVGDEIALMYDGSAGFDFMDALYLGKALEAAGFLWYEEPMREFSIDAYRRLANDLTIPLLSGETSDGAHWNIADFIQFGAADLVRTSTHYKGGVTGALRVAHLADAHHMRAEVHGGGLANLHICCAIPNTTYYESLVYTNPIIVEQGIDSDGCISAPTAPGIGYDGSGE